MSKPRTQWERSVMAVDVVLVVFAVVAVADDHHPATATTTATSTATTFCGYRGIVASCQGQYMRAIKSACCRTLRRSGRHLRG